MTAEDIAWIRRQYAEAKNRKKQIKILAECFDVKPSAIREIIEQKPPQHGENYARDQKIIALLNGGMNRREVVRECQASNSVVARVAREAIKAGLLKDTVRIGHTYDDEFKAKVINDVIAGGMTQDDAAAKWHVSHTAVSQWVRKYKAEHLQKE